MLLVLVLTVPVVIFGLALSLNHMFHFLIGLENLKVFLCISYIFLVRAGLGVIFVILVVVLTIEITVRLVVLTRVLKKLKRSYGNAMLL